MRTGASYVAALRDGRAVYLDGERVKRNEVYFDRAVLAPLIG